MRLELRTVSALAHGVALLYDSAMNAPPASVTKLHADPPAPQPANIAIVIPTFNEAANVAALVARIRDVMAGLSWEVVFVDDDSDDGTGDALTAMAREDARVRLIRRIGRRGLSSAVVEGVQATTAPLIAVMDADLQHDETLLPAMARAFADDPALDLVVGSRYAAGGSAPDFAPKRRFFSQLATRLSYLVLSARLSDPMSGFFMLRRGAFDIAARRLSNQGYKILLDIVASATRPLRIIELPYMFRERAHGESKFDTMASWAYAALLIDKTIGRVVPTRFVLFAFVGALGIGVHLAVLTSLFAQGAMSFLYAQSIATVAAMTFNFFLNNQLTYRDKRLRGLGSLIRGFIAFCAVCSVGAIANIGIANALFANGVPWFVAALAGVVVGAIWNYAATRRLAWRAG